MSNTGSYQFAVQVVENAAEGIIVTDVKGNIEMVNPAFSTITGYSATEVIGKNPRLLKSGRHTREFYKELWGILHKNGRWKGEIWNRRKNGECYIQWVTIRAIKNEQGRITNYASVFTDITERKNAEQRLAEDLWLAKSIQKSVMPLPLKSEEIEIDVLYVPSKELGGDMYAWYRIDQDRYGIILLDIMGNGIAASLISMSIRSLLRRMIMEVTDPVAVYKELNQHMVSLYNQTETSPLRFFTAIYIVIDTKNKMIEYVNAGHPAGFMSCEDGAFFELDKGGVPVGMLHEPFVEKGTIPYKSASNILLYTDGLIEEAGISLGRKMDELKNILRGKENQHSVSLVEILSRKYIENHPLLDDVCMIFITIPERNL